MRVVIAMIKHETNTFSPVPTPLERFGDGGPYWGNTAYRQYKNTATPIGAYIELAEAAGADIAVPVAAEAWPSGPVAAEADRALNDAVAAEVAKGCDLILLDLHGAMMLAANCPVFGGVKLISLSGSAVGIETQACAACSALMSASSRAADSPLIRSISS